MLRRLDAEAQHRPEKKSPNMAVKADCGKGVAGFLLAPQPLTFNVNVTKTMKRLPRSILTVALLAFPTLCRAGGTDRFDAVERLLRTEPTTYAWLAANLELPDSVFAEVRLGSHFKHLGGMRLGPYTFRSKLKNSAGELEVNVCTRARFLDSKGKELPEQRIEQALQVDEKLVSIQVHDARATSPYPECPQ